MLDYEVPTIEYVECPICLDWIGCPDYPDCYYFVDWEV